MFSMGIVVGIGLIITFFKLSWKARLRMLGRPLLMDIGVFIALNVLHWGTFSGLMVAAIGAVVCSLTISALRKTYGYIVGNVYYPGAIDVISKLR